MVARVLLTFLTVLLAAGAFSNADSVPDVNLFGVLFLFIAFIVWFIGEKFNPVTRTLASGAN